MTDRRRRPSASPSLFTAVAIAGITTASLAWAAQGLTPPGTTAAPASPASPASSSESPSTVIARLKASIAADRASLSQPDGQNAPQTVASSSLALGAPAGQGTAGSSPVANSRVTYSSVPTSPPGPSGQSAAPSPAPPVPVAATPVTTPPVAPPPVAVVSGASGAH
ncbi:MAG: hypothetical protein WCI12_09830 [Actinomycetes bacterium]